eukprot:scaffold4541_cov121-Skeletonema_marinoi.AAC.14
MYYAGREVYRKMPTKRSRCCSKSTPLSEFIISMHSTLSHPLPLTDSSRHPCKMRSIAKKKTVKFSPNAKLRSFAASGNDLQAQSSWLTPNELSSMKKRAQNLSILHYIKTRPGKPKAPSNRSGIVYNCHPAHYEIIGESLRGMERYTDISQARRRERLRSDAIKLVEEHQNLNETIRSKLACMYRETAEEAMVYARKIAEEDANIAAVILAEDLTQARRR